MREKEYESHQKNKMFGEIPENKGKEREEIFSFLLIVVRNETAERKNDDLHLYLSKTK